MSKSRRTGYKVVREGGHRMGGCAGRCIVCDGFKVDRSLLSALEQEKEHCPFEKDSDTQD